MEEVVNHEVNSNSYLIFRLGQELYGTPLLDVREVAEYQKPKPVPHSARHFSGVINIRGEILATLDMRVKYNYEAKMDRTTSLLVFETRSGNVAAVVDSLVSVVELTKAEVDKGGHIDMGFPAESFLGIGKLEEGMVTLLDLKQILQSDSIIRAQDFKKAV